MEFQIAVAQWVVLDAACEGRGKAFTCVNLRLPQEPATLNQNQTKYFHLCSKYVHSSMSCHLKETMDPNQFGRSGARTEENLPG